LRNGALRFCLLINTHNLTNIVFVVQISCSIITSSQRLPGALGRPGPGAVTRVAPASCHVTGSVPEAVAMAVDVTDRQLRAISATLRTVTVGVVILFQSMTYEECSSVLRFVAVFCSKYIV